MHTYSLLIIDWHKSWRYRRCNGFIGTSLRVASLSTPLGSVALMKIVSFCHAGCYSLCKIIASRVT